MNDSNNNGNHDAELTVDSVSSRQRKITAEQVVSGNATSEMFIPADPLEVFTITAKEHKRSAVHTKVHRTVYSSIQKVTALAVFTSLGYTLRMNIMVLYMRTFYDNTSVISLVTFASALFGAFDSLIQATLADRWRFDTLIVIAAFVDIITFAFEASAWSFLVIAIAHITSGQPLQGLGNAYVVRMLPVKDSKRQIALYFQIFAVAYIIGPVLGGMFFYYIFINYIFI